MSHTDLFSAYYTNQFWANSDSSSGPNSAYETTPILRKNLQQLLKQLEARSILDLGCGDANIFGHLDLNGISYTGVDCVSALIEHAQQKWSTRKMNFLCADLLTTPLPSVDLVVCRDVLHYLPNELIYMCLANILTTRSRFVLLTHNLASSLSANTETELGIFRPVNLTCRPFYLPNPYLTVLEDVPNKALALWTLNQLGQVK